MKAVEVNIGDLGSFVSGGGLPEGNYAFEFNWQLFQATKKDGSTAGPSRLGIMVTAHSLDDASAEPRQQFYSAGSKTHESFTPNPDNGGKGLVVVAGGAGHSGLPANTNYYYLLKSFYDCGLPQGVFTNDISVLDGVHVHTKNMPEPEERKSMVSKTSEVADEPRKNNTISVISEILEGGSPWEGGGGIPEKGAKKAAGKAVAGKAPVKAAVAAKAPVKAAAKAAAPVVEAEYSEEDLQSMATDAVTAILEEKPEGCPKVQVTTGVFKAIAKLANDDVASSVIDTFFKDADLFNSILEPLGYAIKGLKVMPIEA